MPQKLVLTVLFFTLSLFAGQSPYRAADSSDWLLLGGSAVVGGAAHVLGTRMHPLSPAEIAALDAHSINRWDRPAVENASERARRWSDFGLHSSLLLPAFLVADERMRDHGRTLALMYLQTMTAVGAVTELAKVSFKRVRPYAYAVGPTSRLPIDARKSFFSGHTSASFAGAVFFAKVYSDFNPDSRWTPAVWAASLALASSVAYWRVAAGKHFPSDVMVGALVGSAVGYGIPALHKRGADTNLTATASPMMINVSLCF